MPEPPTDSDPPSSPPPPSPPPQPPPPFDGSGDGASLFALLAAELRRVADNIARREVGHTMQPTALVNELYMKFFGGRPRSWNDQVHFMRSAAVTMSHILIEHKRTRAAQKRGGNVRVEPLDLVVEQLEARCQLEANCRADLLDVHDALQKLAEEDPQLAELVSLHYFGGRTVAEAASLMGISESCGRNHLKFAHAWLHARLQS